MSASKSIDWDEVFTMLFFITLAFLCCATGNFGCSRDYLGDYMDRESK